MPSSETRRARPFLCHASADKPAVRALYRRLRDHGFDPWLDEENLVPGQDWQLEISKAVRSADVVLVCLSRLSASKEGFVQKEIKFALDAADEKPEGVVFIIPARLEDCEVPERLKRWQWVNLFEREGYNKLLRALSLQATGSAEMVVAPLRLAAEIRPALEHPNVFISYSHDSPVHEAKVLALANRLRADGIDAVLDQYESFPAEAWEMWGQRRIQAARFVLVVCTGTYRRRFDGEEESGKGLGATPEAGFIRQLLCNANISRSTPGRATRNCALT